MSTDNIISAQERDEYATTRAIKEVFAPLPHIGIIGTKYQWLDFDKETDVLQVIFGRPQRVTDTDILEDGGEK